MVSDVGSGLGSNLDIGHYGLVPVYWCLYGVISTWKTVGVQKKNAAIITRRFHSMLYVCIYCIEMVEEFTHLDFLHVDFTLTGDAGEPITAPYKEMTNYWKLV